MRLQDVIELSKKGGESKGTRANKLPILRIQGESCLNFSQLNKLTEGEEND